MDEPQKNGTGADEAPVFTWKGFVRGNKKGVAVLAALFGGLLLVAVLANGAVKRQSVRGYESISFAQMTSGVLSIDSADMYTHRMPDGSYGEKAGFIVTNRGDEAITHIEIYYEVKTDAAGLFARGEKREERVVKSNETLHGLFSLQLMAEPTKPVGNGYAVMRRVTEIRVKLADGEALRAANKEK